MEHLSFIRAHLVELHRLAKGIPTLQYFIAMAITEADDCIACEMRKHASGGSHTSVKSQDQLQDGGL